MKTWRKAGTEAASGTGAAAAQGPAPLLIMHIPKTAGTTLRAIAGAQYPEGGLWTAYSREDLDALRDPARAKAVRAVMGHFPFGVHEWIFPEAKYVTLFREPVSQAISLYNHLINSDTPLHRRVIGAGGGLADFLEHDWARNMQTQYLTSLSRAEIERDPDLALRRAKEILDDHFVCFGITERFEESLHLLAHFLDWHIPFLENLNTAEAWPKRIKKNELAAPLLERVRAANSCDTRLYNYAVETFQKVFAETCPFWDRVAWRSAHWARWARHLPRRIMTFGLSRG